MVNLLTRRHVASRNLCNGSGEGTLGPYFRTSYDISEASDWSRWPSQKPTIYRNLYENTGPDPVTEASNQKVKIKQGNNMDKPTT